MEFLEKIPTDILVYAAIAGVLLLWLRSVLGTRNSADRQRPNPFTLPQGAPAPASAPGAQPAASSTAGTPVDAGLVQIALADRGFDTNRFLETAKETFSAAVAAFADGDRARLKELLTPDVYAGFDRAIGAREAAGQKAMTEVLMVRDADIIDAKMDGRNASITLRIKADESYALTDASGKTIAGDPERVVTMTDVWTFTRDVKAKGSPWLVSQTRDDVKEKDAPTLPEAGITV